MPETVFVSTRAQPRLYPPPGFLPGVGLVQYF
jgi:hypothetical protein